MSRHTLFISDLHLDPSEPKITEAFLQFLQQQAPQADALYILGDFFEVWIGDDDLNDFNLQIIRALKNFTQLGIPTYFMHGNRDFLIGKKFAQMTGVKLIRDPSIINLYGRLTLLVHGDSLCTLDLRHQKSRKIMHNKLYQKAVLWFLPLSYRRKKAREIRERSHQRNRGMMGQIMDVTPQEVERVMQEAKVNLLVHGHTHRPAVHSLEVNGAPAQRIVLGAWHPQGEVLRADSDGKLELLDIRHCEPRSGEAIQKL